MNAEAKLAAPLVPWLQAQGWDVYQEVSIGYACQRADVVAVRGGLLWAIEAKTSLSFEVIAQARRWRQYAHLGSVCVPAPRRKGADLGRDLALRVCEAEGVGVLTVDVEAYADKIQVELEPRPARNALVSRLRAALHPEQKTAARAGSNQGGYWTPWQRTCRDLVAIVQVHPGITLKALIESLQHHYASDASARGSLLKCAEQGLIKGVQVRRDGRAVLFYPVD